MDDAEARRRSDLNGWINQSRSVQRRLPWVLAGGIVLTVALWIAGLGSPYVPLAAMVTAVVVGSGYWITHGHILDFRSQLAALDAARFSQRDSAASRPARRIPPRREPFQT